MPYPIKAHTLPLLERILATENLGDRVQAFIDSRGGKTDDFHEYLVSVEANEPLYNLIYDTLGTSRCAPYTLNIPTDADISAYINACRNALTTNEKKWDIVDFQSNPGYLLCGNETVPDERIILNFKNQTDALSFAANLRDHVGSRVKFKILLGSHLEAIHKNDKIVIYYPKAQRAGILTLVNAIPAAQLSPQISGFYLKVKDGIGIAAETDPNWSFTMFTAEYCMKYLVNHSPAGKEKNTPATAEGMYAYVVRRLLKNGRIPDSLADPADLPAAE